MYRSKIIQSGESAQTSEQVGSNDPMNLGIETQPQIGKDALKYTGERTNNDDVYTGLDMFSEIGGMVKSPLMKMLQQLQASTDEPYKNY